MKPPTPTRRGARNILSYYILAIRGTHKIEGKDGAETYMIWGWGGIARRTQSSESHRDLFHEARYNLALCRFKDALTSSGAERTNLLEQAQRDIVIVYTLYPKMGGKLWYDRYDALLKQIQKRLGVKEDGLKAFEKKSAGTKARPAVACTLIGLLQISESKSPLPPGKG